MCVAGDGQWGVGSMQHDLSDAVAWAVDRGVADPKRVCIMGSSYGGYATFAGEQLLHPSPRSSAGRTHTSLKARTLTPNRRRTKFPRGVLHIHLEINFQPLPLSCTTGLAFTPELYRCGVAFSGISNLADFARSMPPYWGGPIRTRWLLRVGNVTADEKLNRRLSPVFHAGSVRAPLLMGQGENDVRVSQVGGGLCSSCGLIAASAARASCCLPVTRPVLLRCAGPVECRRRRPPCLRR